MPDAVSIDVTLSLADDPVAPEDADFIAASNQIGSGTESEVAEMTTTDETNFQDNAAQEVMAQPAPTPEVTEQAAQLLSAEASAEFQANKEFKEFTDRLDEAPTSRYDREKLLREIASLEARIAEEQQALAKMPRTKRINSMSTRSAVEAAYLNGWRQKCERIGRINYPAGSLEGEVLILVSILADGSLQEVRVLESSGHRELDQAALATVRQAAPFQPFNNEMRKAYDRLEFTRWWQFNQVKQRSS
jgi:protein TonB